MEVKVVNSAVLHGGAPPGAAPPPPTVFDRLAADIHVAVLFAFAAPTATNGEIERGLEKTLAEYYTLAGRLDRRRVVLAGGALLVRATVDAVLADHVPFEPNPALQALHPPTAGVDRALQVQLTRFRCGGLVVGVTAHHRVADGQSMSNFYKAWGRAVNGHPVEPRPVYDPRPWLTPRNPPRPSLAFLPVLTPVQTPVQNTVVNLALHYSLPFISSALRREPFTTFECLLAHLWRKITTARGLTGDDSTEVRVAVDCRRRLTPAAPAAFTGNLVVNARPSATAAELAAGGVPGAARRVRAAVKLAAEEWLPAAVDFGEVYGEEEWGPLVNEEEEMGLFPDLEVNSWLGFRFREVEFGGGRGGACAFAPSWIAAEGVVVFVPSPAGDGGVDVVVSLFESHADVLRGISHVVD
ncbi:agmatine hydroxycinnamoyltransferase 1-like [Wolffia australiana]